MTDAPDGIPIHYETHGSGAPALVFVHGWSCDRTYWRHQVPHFAERHCVVAVDLAGHGESGDGRGTWTMPAFGGDVTAVVEALKLDDVVLVGHSMGGDVIVETAVRLPERVRGLVWVDVYSTLGEPRSQEAHEAFVASFRDDFAASAQSFVRRMFVPKSDPELVDWVADDMSSAPPEIALEAMAHAVGNDGPILDRLRELRAPLVAINPDSPRLDVDALGRYDIRTIVVRDVGHFLMLEDPATFNRLLAETVEAF